MILCLPEMSPNFACHVVNMVLSSDKTIKRGISYKLNPIENHGVEITLHSYTRFHGDNHEEVKAVFDNMNLVAKEVFDFLEFHVGPRP